MDVNVYTAAEASNDQLAIKIKNRESFIIEEIKLNRFASTVKTLEKIIESQGLKCRIYTTGRIATTGLAFLGGWSAIAGVVSGATIAAHNIATWNPDYEIGKDLTSSKITVTYKKNAN